MPVTFEGKYINGTTLVVDGGLWLSRPRHLPKEAVKQLSRAVEKRSRGVPVGVPKSKLLHVQSRYDISGSNDEPTTDIIQLFRLLHIKLG